MIIQMATKSKYINFPETKKKSEFKQHTFLDEFSVTKLTIYFLWPFLKKYSQMLLRQMSFFKSFNSNATI